MRIHAGITRAVSEHVHVIPAEGRSGVPNVGIVVGSRAVLIIESGLGSASGQTILEEARRIAGARPLYVIATHFHPEHIGGEQAFASASPSATVLRPLAQQREIEEGGAAVIEMFRGMSSDNRLLLKDFSFRSADIVFDGAMTLDLGGVIVDIVRAGPAHTDGDIAFFVREDGVLFTGDVVQQNYAPLMMGEHSSLASWLAQIDKLEKLPARIIVPSHSALTDRQALGDMRDMLVFLRDRWSVISKSKVTGREAQDRLVADFKQRFPGCKNAEFVRVSIPKL
jgi:glyoxylase-like metal-dependent hydrolase (beta-lactamase superfamily II)